MRPCLCKGLRYGLWPFSTHHNPLHRLGLPLSRHGPAPDPRGSRFSGHHLQPPVVQNPAAIPIKGAAGLALYFSQ
jgi:hypothetical protein